MSTSFSSYVSAYPFLAYSLVWDDFYRDENFQSPITPDKDTVPDYLKLSTSALADVLDGSVNGWLKRVCWRKDYFTSALPWQQRGVAPALPISGVLPVQGQVSLSGFGDVFVDSNANPAGVYNIVIVRSPDYPLYGAGVQVNKDPTTSDDYVRNQVKADISQGTASFTGTTNLANAATFNISDLRLAYQLQRWMERNAIGGVRYTEFLRSHFGVSPRDERLDRPEYIGGAKMPVISARFCRPLRHHQTVPRVT